MRANSTKAGSIARKPPTAPAEVGVGAAGSLLIEAIRSAFLKHANPAQARPMQAYMKSALPFHGIAAPQRRRLMAEAVAARPCRSTRELGQTMQALWLGATHREERYAAMELARVGPHRALLDATLLPLYERMIVESAWWDICDDISGEAIGTLLQREPQVVKAAMRRWAVGDDLWLRRAAILAQRRVKQGFDAPLLYECILASIGERPFAKEFFIRKSIGWALRERSYSAPEEVQAFCREYAAQLAPLTVREALKVIVKRSRS
jgi:3-methyladenine DNA glycosylase AlkD